MVRETVAVAVGKEFELEVCDCAQVKAAAAKIRAREKFFTVFSNLGEIQKFLIFYMVRDAGEIEKNGKGWAFSNTNGRWSALERGELRWNEGEMVVA